MKCNKVILLFVLFCLIVSITEANKTVVIRVGHFPNVTHAQGVIGEANAWFQKALGPDVKIEWKIFNAGPSAIEAMFASELDLTYIGPNPAINGYIKSNGEALRIICGATSGGAALVVRNDAGINEVKDFHGKRIASPQLGNTQDVALRMFLKENGFVLKEQGGDVEVIPLKNPDQLMLFLKKEIDAAWTVEPWVSRLVKEGNGKVFLDEASRWPQGEYVITHLIVSTKFLKEHPDLVEKWVEAHVSLTDWINKNKEEAKRVMNKEIEKETGKALPEDVLDSSLARCKITYDPIKSSLFTSAKWAFNLGFLGEKEPDLANIYELGILNKVLKDKGLKQIK
jgi:NitT/TauT family transport system substrate-binding protein